MTDPKFNVSVSTLEIDHNNNNSEDMELPSLFVPTPATESENESSSESQHESGHANNMRNDDGELETDKTAASAATPTPSAPAFDLVEAAEALLAHAKKLKAIIDSKPTPPFGSPESANHAPSPPSPEEIELRQRVAKLGKKIAFETAPPMDSLKSDWVTIADVAAWNIFLHWRAFDHIPLTGSISIADLARAINADESLVSRIACMLISTGKLIGSRLGGEAEKGPPTHVSHSRISRLLRTNTSPATAALAIVSFGNGMKGFAKWPEYFSTYDRQEPHPSDNEILVHDSNGIVVTTKRRGAQDGTSKSYIPTPFSLGWGHPALAPWEVKARYPEYARHFEMAMAAKDKGAQGALGGDLGVGGYRGINSEYPANKFSLTWLAEVAQLQRQLQQQLHMLGDVNTSLKPLVVDVGGGLGHFLANLLANIPEVKPEQCILLDRPEVIAQVAKNMEGGDERLKGVMTMAHDFFQPQPEEAKGATVYVVRRVLLDYCDEQAVWILKHLRCALSGSEGRIVIMEGVLLDKPTPENRLVDMVMMNLGGKLRNAEGYRKLCKEAGLKVTGYWVDVEGASCVVECVKEDGTDGSEE
ncbi:O-methyltransferase-domain-containing protein [Neurospora hispaniola]|uniref:O-methyltransferase-domain-containing protein n=1 Tax=Neurospora hispaniola TaxID=588809 RepID=A0AAJ0MQX9_9PEZI|nr:O-methyltransferase-domain-containing protein [Neurospora hispaniola]